MIVDTLERLTFRFAIRAGQLRFRAGLFRKAITLRIAAAIADRLIPKPEGWEDVEDDPDPHEGALPWTHVFRGNGPVVWPLFRNGEPPGRTDGAVMMPGLPLVPSDPYAFFCEHVLPARFTQLAERWKESCGANTTLPMRGTEIAWDFANSMMAREALMAKYIVLRTLGLEDNALADALTKRILNEWHGLPPLAGLGDNELDLLRTERSKEPRA